ncbi:uncharacterized protein LOC117289918 [Asterias rubens]|uniref:uncharacterized protein LOC117289918 n=1 Tax=Asterias rubens TaxID=7604 RepID=UPI001454EB40|nr:uncharacterized protein LOC117289918 [Asterias rubens]
MAFITKLTIPLLLVACAMRGYECILEGVEFTCNVDEFRCDNKQRCILYSQRCDGVTQCKDHEDEENCPERLMDLLEEMLAERLENPDDMPQLSRSAGQGIPIIRSSRGKNVLVDIIVREEDEKNRPKGSLLDE